jgi:hypothetical protein
MRYIKNWQLLAAVSIPLFTSGILAHNIMQDANEQMRMNLCVHHLKVMAVLLSGYAKDHDGKYPDRLSALYPEYIPDLEAFIYPELTAIHNSDRTAPHPFSSDAPASDEIDELSSYT